MLTARDQWLDGLPLCWSFNAATIEKRRRTQSTELRGSFQVIYGHGMWTDGY